jgi:hypothetical protein
MYKTLINRHGVVLPTDMDTFTEDESLLGYNAAYSRRRRPTQRDYCLLHQGLDRPDDGVSTHP